MSRSRVEKTAPASDKNPGSGNAAIDCTLTCRECFFWAFETEIHQTIVAGGLFRPGDYVAIGASGGKDSTVLAYVMKRLNDQYDYGLRLVLLSIGTNGV